jgi:hypothetical protein
VHTDFKAAVFELYRKEVTMLKKRSLKNRYFRFLKRFWPMPALAALLVSLASCSSRAASTGAPSSTPPTPDMHRLGPSLGVEPWHDWHLQLLPTELHLSPEFRFSCSPLVALPPSLLLDEADEVLDTLEPLASCLTLGPMARERLYLAGPSELPGRWAAPLQGAGRADELRSILTLLGVPFENVVTHDLDSGQHVELGVEDGASKPAG